MSNASVTITWIGHACFKLEKGDYSVIMDPYADGSVPGVGSVREKANEVTCSHEHHDHNARETVELIDAPVSANPFTITKLHTFHDDVMGAKRGRNVISVYDDGKLRIAHMGDLGCALTEEEKEQLGNVAVMMIPVGGFFTIDGEQAAAIVKELGPKVVIPMHYRSEKFGFDMIGTADAFVSAFDKVIRKDGPSITAEEVQAMDAGTTVVLLTPQNLI